MTKEQVQKHGEVIKWFCDNHEKGVWLQASKEDWEHTYVPNFKIHLNYVQNDEYAELRKAQADGKVIQFDEGRFEQGCMGVQFLTSNWVDKVCAFDQRLEYYRIKPEDTKFKRTKNGEVVKCLGNGKYLTIFSENMQSIKLIVACSNLENIHYDGHFYDKQPVWCWDDGDICNRDIHFYDAINGCAFDNDGTRGGTHFKNYEAVSEEQLKVMPFLWKMYKLLED